MAGREFGTDPFGIIARGDPSASNKSGFSVGRVGNPVRDYSNPGRTVGTGVGVKVNVPITGSGGTYKPETKGAKPSEKLAKGGAAKKSGCSVKAYGDMIKKEAGAKPVKKARGGAGKVRKGMMSPSGNILQAVKPKKNKM